MASRDNHYEAAFETFLRNRRVPYVAVDEARRSLAADEGSLKNVDFLVSAAQSRTWLVDVKGRRFPSGGTRQFWKNWSTRDDLRSLARWEQLFGASAQGLFVFAYNIVGEWSPLPAERLFEYRGALYGFVGIRLREYACHARLISPKWETVAMPAREFRRLAEPVENFL